MGRKNDGGLSQLPESSSDVILNGTRIWMAVMNLVNEGICVPNLWAIKPPIHNRRFVMFRRQLGKMLPTLIRPAR